MVRVTVVSVNADNEYVAVLAGTLNKEQREQLVLKISSSERLDRARDNGYDIVVTFREVEVTSDIAVLEKLVPNSDGLDFINEELVEDDHDVGPVWLK